MEIRMKFKLVESIIVYRGVSPITRKSNEFAGRFFATTYDEAYNFGDVEISQIMDTARLYNGLNSLDFCEKNNLLGKNYPFLKRMFGVDSIKDLDDNRQLFATQAVAKYELEKQGYDGAHWKYEDDLIPEQYQIWNLDVLE